MVDLVEVEAQAPVARVCQENGCVTVLSQYNSTSWCGVHSRRDWRASREPRRRATVPASAGDGDDGDW